MAAANRLTSESRPAVAEKPSAKTKVGKDREGLERVIDLVGTGHQERKPGFSAVSSSPGYR